MEVGEGRGLRWLWRRLWKAGPQKRGTSRPASDPTGNLVGAQTYASVTGTVRSVSEGVVL